MFNRLENNNKWRWINETGWNLNTIGLPLMPYLPINCWLDGNAENQNGKSKKICGRLIVQWIVNVWLHCNQKSDQNARNGKQLHQKCFCFQMNDRSVLQDNEKHNRKYMQAKIVLLLRCNNIIYENWIINATIKMFFSSYYFCFCFFVEVAETCFLWFLEFFLICFKFISVFIMFIMFI